MFRPCRKSALVKKLLRFAAEDATTDHPNEAEAAKKRKAAAQRVLRRLRLADLDVLLRVIEQKGRNETSAGGECVEASCSTSPSPHLAVARLFRWQDLGEEAVELRRLSMCGAVECTADVQCCNPYHWSRIGEQETSCLIPC
jgi:hypothetical protein